MTSRSDGGRRWMPAGAVTGIGSLPIVDPLEAIDFVSETCPVLPFCPQPPRRPVGGHAGRAVRSGRQGQGDDCALRGCRAAAGAFPRARHSRPSSPARSPWPGSWGPGRGDDDTAAVLAALASAVAQKAAEQVEVLAIAGLPVLVYVDEPALVIVEPALATGCSPS